ncbi:MAG: D-2-hydroxyacid dehydrogenase [Bacteroidetes bacterium]|uniref:D-2-hydroxyacid dehydrogenase n=1 Tax=Candidatus Cryptobacteroides intestinavium TaxID=2840766 RepID=A0A9D9ERY1_9BACT|nr:D-2-hydroxyacid dehydrogenase [Candidatus Cryptobacteroides intestinavium]
MKIVFLDAATMGDVSFSPISALGELECFQTSDREEALQRVKDAEVLIINKIKVDKELVDAAPKLRLICEAATGVNNIDLEYAASKGIPVRNAVGYSTDSVVQMTFMMILSLVGRCRYFDDFVKSGEYSRSGLFTDVSKMFFELRGKRLGIIGLGNIGGNVAKVGEAFGMNVSYFSTSGTSHSKDYPSVDLDTLMSSSDIISIHAPYNERTAGLVGAEQLRKMKSTAYIVNMGRGGIIDEAALAEAIDGGWIAGAGVDVFTAEPLPADNPLLNVRNRDRLILTPHIGWASIEARERLVAMIADNIAAGY